MLFSENTERTTFTNFDKFFYFLHTHNYTSLTGICLLQIMQETLSFFMFLLQVKDKNAETKQDKEKNKT